MTVALSILLTAAAGYPAARRRGVATPGLAFLYGSGLVFIVLELLAFFGVPWSRATVLPALAVTAIAFGFALPRAASGARFRPAAGDALTVAILAFYVLYSTAAPPWGWDYWAIWGLKARTFFEKSGIDWEFLQAQTNAFAHPTYPLLVPLNLSFTGVMGGAWDDRWLGLMFAAYAAAIGLVTREIAARELAPLPASAIAFSVTALACSQHVGLAEVPMIALGTAGLLYVRSAVRGTSADWLPGAVLLGLAASTKMEGLFLLASVAAMLALSGRWRSIMRLWPAALFPAPWIVSTIVKQLSIYVTTGSGLDRLVSRLPELPAFARLLALTIDKGWCWILVLLALPLVIRWERFLLGIIVMQALLFFGALLSTPLDLAWHVTSAWERLSRQLLAPAAYAALAALAASFATSFATGFAAKGREHAEAGFDD